MIKLAIVSPCYNEEEVLEQSAARLTALFDELVGKEKISADSFVLFVMMVARTVRGTLSRSCIRKILT